jgi:hypothetical protein
MIDVNVLDRNLKDCIQQFPVKVRHKGREMFVKLNATQDILQTIESATRDNMAITVIGAKSDFSDRPPKSMDDMDVMVGDRWIKFQVQSVPDFFDPLSPGYMINLQSSQKGVE